MNIKYYSKCNGQIGSEFSDYRLSEIRLHNYPSLINWKNCVGMSNKIAALGF